MMNNYYPNQQYGFGYGAPRPQARNTQPLTPDQIQKLRQNSNAFDMKVEQEDLWRAACTHKEKNGASTLVQNNDGSYTCTICHETFAMCDSDEADIEKAVKTLTDMLQTSKTVYLDAPEELIRQYYQIIPLLKKFPALWKRAIQNFSMYEGTMTGALNTMGPGYSGFAAMQNLLTNPYAGYAPQQPQYQYPQYQAPTMPMQQPYGYASQMPMAPMMDPNMANPMAYGQPAPMNQAPVAPAPGVMPAAPAPAPAAPAAAPATGEVQQQQTFNV